MNARIGFLRIFLVWLAISVAVGAATLVVCGGFESFVCDGHHASVYTPVQRILFLIAWVYSFPVTAIFAAIGKTGLLDIHVSPFMLEIADLKTGPGAVVFYAGFYAGVTMLVLEFIGRLRKRIAAGTV